MKRLFFILLFSVTIAEIFAQSAGGRGGGRDQGGSGTETNTGTGRGSGSSGTNTGTGRGDGTSGSNVSGSGRGQNGNTSTGTNNSPGKGGNSSGSSTNKPGAPVNNMFSTSATVKMFEYGLKAGIVVNKLSTNMAAYTSTNYIGFKGGFFTRFNIKRWYIQPEINFAMNGGSVYANGTQYNIRTGAIEVPVLAGYRIIDLNFFRLRLYAGPYVSYNVIQKFGGNSPYRDGDIRRINAGLMAGVGLDIWKIGVDLRYQFGVINMVKTDPAFQNPLTSARNGIFEISLSYRF